MAGRLPALWKRFSSTITPRPIPPKAHHHAPIPDHAFPRGYVLTGLHAGVKKTGALDLALILSTTPDPASAAACFTRNAFKAAPVVVSEEVLQRNGGTARAVVVNSGCANAVTGKQGMEDAWAMVRATDALSGADKAGANQTLVMSTGVIGQYLPIAKIIAGIQSQAAQNNSLGSTFDAWERAAKALMTTDTFPKLRARTFTINGKEYRMAGMDKGAGMIHPDMGPPRTIGQLHATLLGCILTDAAVSRRSLQSALTYAVDRSFNSISVDGDMSTNDTILVLANGAAVTGSGILEEIDEERDPAAYEIFRDEFTAFATDLAQLVVRDGEGATKFITVSVEGAATYADAHLIASRISTSALVKTALYGQDANWGRILAATGSVPLSTPLDPKRVSVSFIPTDGSPVLPLLVNGEPEMVDEARAKEILSVEDLEVRVQLGIGKESAKYWTCDFSYDYVRINGDYRS
ncbi:arginine biosynthesis bifunctional protein ArgJ beta chain [Laetiporus sulphureus 93-53]|uniref:Arginine biosynthesis bifunctional protein ArgJ, mitochondrial n=1 Tax=Laetiporus sulphureus 93-53 TaxID=1314785 RepID=A0A165EPJ1_9APHY|nr:arginine biosynthesis bifunctional protein ArgJ beta chain [Laetiporus sulphureus 93-53]KZT07496.1 arginine biosynthesis bifunctional protein ArgJ beta chain [Laetiporus sulphureus 93-53]